MCNLETGSASHEKSSVAVSILGTVSNSFLLQSGLGLGLGLGYVWGYVLGKENVYRSYTPLYIMLNQSGLYFGARFGLGFCL